MTVMNTKFPEHFFPVKDGQYLLKSIYDGIEICKEKRVAFCGIVRNGGKILSTNIHRIFRTGSVFKSFDVFIYENNSTDQTVEILNSYKSKSFIFESESLDTNHDNAGAGSHSRLKRISTARNKYVEWISNKIDNYDYVIVVDLDIKGGWSYNGVINSVYELQDEKAGCMTAYGVLADFSGNTLLTKSIIDDGTYLMYDSLAFRGINSTGPITTQQQIKHNHLKVDFGSQPIAVRSNFNGIGVYKSKCFEGNCYDSIDHGKSYVVDCDHVIFHDNIYKKGLTVNINPNLISSYSEQGL